MIQVPDGSTPLPRKWQSAATSVLHVAALTPGKHVYMRLPDGPGFTLVRAVVTSEGGRRLATAFGDAYVSGDQTVHVLD